VCDLIPLCCAPQAKVADAAESRRRHLLPLIAHHHSIHSLSHSLITRASIHGHIHLEGDSSSGLLPTSGVDRDITARDLNHRYTSHHDCSFRLFPLCKSFPGGQSRRPSTAASGKAFQTTWSSSRPWLMTDLPPSFSLITLTRPVSDITLVVPFPPTPSRLVPLPNSATHSSFPGSRH